MKTVTKIFTEGNEGNKGQTENASPSFSSLTSVKKEGIVYFLAREIGEYNPARMALERMIPRDHRIAFP